MIIIRKLMFVFTIVVVILADGTSPASAASKTEKYKGPLMKMCRIYQIGEDEFMLRLSGRTLPVPKCRTEDNTLYITLNDSKVYHSETINASVKSAMEAIPLLYDFNAVNVSDDDSFRVEMEIKSNTPLKVHSVSNAVEGISIRVKSDVIQELALGNTYVPPPKQAPSPETKLPFAVSSRITLELRDAELRDIIRGIMAYIGRNVIIDPSFPGGGGENSSVLITMTLNDVRVDEILNNLMRTYDLACYVSGVNTLTFGSREGLYKLSGENTVKYFKIHFAEPAQVSTMLKTLTAIEDNAITVDDRIKALYVKTNPAKMQEVEELIDVLDAPQKQVMIRASIFEFNDTDSVAVENALNVMYDDIQLTLNGGITVNYRNDRSIRGTRTVWTQRVVTGTLNALETKAKGKVLANPSVIALDGKKAEINLTQDYPYISSRGKDDRTVTWSTEEVGPKLSFTPRIGRDGYVTLTLDVSTGDVVDVMTSSTGEQMPVTTTRSVKTDVRVKDGMPFVVGGLFREDTVKSVSRIPILGNIPLLGELFTSRTNSKNKTQVVMIITPYILDSK